MLTVFCCQVLIIWWIGSNRTLFLVPDFCCLICLVYSKALCNVTCAMSGPCFKDGCTVIYIRDGERIGQRRMKGATGPWRNSLGFSHLCTKSLSDDWISYWMCIHTDENTRDIFPFTHFCEWLINKYHPSSPNVKRTLIYIFC